MCDNFIRLNSNSIDTVWRYELICWKFRLFSSSECAISAAKAWWNTSIKVKTTKTFAKILSLNKSVFEFCLDTKFYLLLAIVKIYVKSCRPTLIELWNSILIEINININYSLNSIKTKEFHTLFPGTTNTLEIENASGKTQITNLTRCEIYTLPLVFI